MKSVDARGKSCPEPVMLTKRALSPDVGNIEIFVDNETSKINVERFLKIMGFTVTVEHTEHDKFRICGEKHVK